MRIFALFFIFALTLQPALAADPQAIRIGYLPVTGVAQLYVIQGEGWARRANLALTLTPYDNAADLFTALATGKLDAYYGPLEPVLTGKAGGADVKVVAAAAIDEDALVAVGALADALRNHHNFAQSIEIVHKATNKALRVAVPPGGGSLGSAMFHYYLHNVLATPDSSVELVPLGNDETQAAMLAGTVDAAMLAEPALGIVLDQDPKALVAAAPEQMLRDQPGPVFAVNGAYAAAHSQSVQALVALHIRATDFIHREPAKTASDAQFILGKDHYDLATLVRAITATSAHFVADPNVIGQSTQALQMYQWQSGQIDHPVSLIDLFDRRYYSIATPPPPPVMVPDEGR